MLAWAQAASQHDCLAGERVAFSCVARNQVVSLCAAPAGPGAAAHLSYRIGRPGAHPDLVHPRAGVEPAAAFAAYFTHGTKNTYISVHFQRGAYGYVLYHSRAAFELHARSNGSGVKVFRHGRQLSDLWCDDRSISAQDMWATLKEFQLPAATPLEDAP